MHKHTYFPVMALIPIQHLIIRSGRIVIDAASRLETKMSTEVVNPILLEFVDRLDPQFVEIYNREQGIPLRHDPDELLTFAKQSVYGRIKSLFTCTAPTLLDTPFRLLKALNRRQEVLKSTTLMSTVQVAR